MAAASWWKYARLAWFSKPSSERQLYRLVKLHRIGRIVEVGIGRVERTAALVSVARRYAADGKVSYTGLDWFDARPEGLNRFTLKQAHAELQATGAQVRLVPGEPGRALASAANSLQRTGLLVLSAIVDDSSLSSAWFFVPRMLDAASVVLRERMDSAGAPVFEMLSAQQIVALAGRATKRRAA